MSNVIREIWSNITLLADYRSGSLRDYSPLARHGTIVGTDVRFSPLGAHFSGTGRIVHPDHVAGRQTTGSIVVLTSFNTVSTLEQRFFDAGDAGGNRIRLYAIAGSTQLRIVAGGITSFSAITLPGSKCVAVSTYEGGATKPVFWIDGSTSYTGSANASPTAYACPVTIGNMYNGTLPCLAPIAAVLETNRPLDANEHAAVFAELQNRVWPARPYEVVAPKSLVTSNTRGLVGSWDPGATARGVCPDLSDTGATGTVTGTGNLWVEDSPLGKVARVDGARGIDCGAFAAPKGVSALTISAWMKRTALTTGGIGVGFHNSTTQRTNMVTSGATHYWIVANGTNAYGSYALNDVLWHHFVLRFDGAGVGNAQRLRGWIDGQEVTLAYTDTIPATTSAAAGNWNIGVVSGNQLGSGGPVSVWNRALDPAEIVQEYRRANAAGFKSDWGVPVSSAARGGVIGTELETTGWRFGDTTGRWFVDTSTVQGQPVKTIRCSTGGANVALYRDSRAQGGSAQDAAYGTWDMTLTIPAASGINWHFVTTIPVILGGAGGNQGYSVQASATGAIAIFRMNNGVIISTIKQTAAGFLAINTFYRLRITRDFKGLWTAKVLGGAYSAWTELPDTGAGPFVNPDNTYTVSNYQVLGALTGLVVSLGTTAGNYSFAKSVK